MKAAATFLLGVIVGVAGWATASNVSWGYWLFLAAFVAGVTFLNLHDSRFFESRAERAKKSREAWASHALARMLVQSEGRARPRPWSPEQVTAWCDENLSYVRPDVASISRWPFRRRRHARWLAEYVESLRAEEKQSLWRQLQDEIRSVRNPEWWRDEYE